MLEITKRMVLGGTKQIRLMLILSIIVRLVGIGVGDGMMRPLLLDALHFGALTITRGIFRSITFTTRITIHTDGALVTHIGTIGIDGDITIPTTAQIGIGTTTKTHSEIHLFTLG